MKTKIALILFVSLLAQTGFGQQAQTEPAPANVSTPPRRYSSDEMSRFRALRSTPQVRNVAAPPVALQNGSLISLGDIEASSAPVSDDSVPVEQVSFEAQDSPSVPPATSANQSKPQSSIQVPEILSGKPNSVGQLPNTSNQMPEDISMNQPMVRPTAPLRSTLLSSPPAAKPATQSTTKIQTRPKSEVFSMAPTMPNPGQPPVDLRNASLPVHQASRLIAQPGRVMPVSAKQELVESLTPDAAPATNSSPNLATASPPKQSATASKSPIFQTQSAAASTTAGPNLMRPATTATTPELASSRATKGFDNAQTTINSPGASIEVSTTGPKSISVGKSAAYAIDVVNNGRTAAQQLVVTFTVPTWIELANTNLTTGAKEIARETDATRIMWRIDRLEPGKSQRLTLDVIPRKSQVFELNVEWSVAPLAGAVQVQVTEPLLKMAITGPDEVQFGQSAMYSVTIRNPGTGVAENVNVMLSEVLGGERATLGNIGPGEEKNIQVELIARSAGALELAAGVTGDGSLQDNVSKNITVRRAQLGISLAGPSLKYAGSTGNFQITVENSGDAIAQDVFAAIGLPGGVQYLSGIEAAERIDGGMRWAVGALPPGDKRTYTIACQLVAAGPVQIEAGVRGLGDLAAADSIQTIVETVADLVLSVEDPQGPLPVGQDTVYKIVAKNRGTRTANNVDIVMHFSNGVEPTAAEGRNHKLNPGEVIFETIGQLDPTEEMVFNVTARATAAGTHMFRAQLTCAEADAREVAQGTTKFFGDEAFEVNTLDPSLKMGEQPPSNSIR